jgi:hypothetical protein
MAKLQQFLLLVFLAPLICHAGFVYTYNGGSFESYYGSWNGGGTPTHITASLAFDSPLPANMPWQGMLFPPVWSISDGLHTFDQASPDQYGSTLSLSTDALGLIDYWSFRVVYILSGDYYEDLVGVHLQGGGISEGTAESIGGYPALGIANNYSTLGNWTMSETGGAVPEPGAILLTSSALCLLGFFRPRQ